MLRRSIGSAMGRRWAGLGLLLGLLQIASVVDCSTVLQVLASDHHHAWRTVVDGGHVDLILSHDAARPSVGAEPRIHPKSAEDHVVHMTPDEQADAQRRDVDSLPAAPSPPVVRLAAVFVSPRAPAFAPPRMAAPFSRRSVVLRT